MIDHKASCLMEAWSAVDKAVSELHLLKTNFSLVEIEYAKQAVHHLTSASILIRNLYEENNRNQNQKQNQQEDV